MIIKEIEKEIALIDFRSWSVEAIRNKLNDLWEYLCLFDKRQLFAIRSFKPNRSIIYSLITLAILFQNIDGESQREIDSLNLGIDRIFFNRYHSNY